MSDLKIAPLPAFEPGLKPVVPERRRQTARPQVDFGELVKRSIDGVNETQMKRPHARGKLRARGSRPWTWCA